MPSQKDCPTLMLLGGASHQVPAIEAAKKLGYRTVLCDYLPDNPGQYVADVFYRESTADRQRILQIAKDENINGIISFGSDVAAPTAAYVSEQLGFPTNPLRSVEILSEKHLFKDYLTKHGFNCPKAVSFTSQTSIDEIMSLCNGMHYPILIKPTDSSGSRGISLIQSSSQVEFEKAFHYANDFSRNNILIAEEFIEYTYPHMIGGDIFVLEGKVVFWGLMASLRSNKAAKLVPVGEAYPCGLDSSKISLLKDEVQRLVTSLDLRYGEMNIEIIIGPEGHPYILELGGRAGGNMIPLQLQDISGIDLITASVACAMGQHPGSVSFTEGNRCVSTSMIYASKSGLFDSVRYDNVLKPHIFREALYVKRGDPVEELRYGSQAIGILFLAFSNEQEMWDILNRIDALVEVSVQN